MNKPVSFGKKLLTVSGALLLLVFIISTAVVLALNLRFVYYHDIDALHIAKKTGLAAEEIKRNYDALIDYNLLWNKGDLQLPGFPMSENGAIHFREVKAIFDTFQILFLTSLAGLSIIWIWAKNSIGRGFARLAGWGCFVLVGILGLFTVLGWDKLFVGFHKVFFNNDFWIFNADTDPVITILPEAFFMHEAILILGLVLLGGGTALFFGLKKGRKQ